MGNEMTNRRKVAKRFRERGSQSAKISGKFFEGNRPASFFAHQNSRRRLKPVVTGWSHALDFGQLQLLRWGVSAPFSSTNFAYNRLCPDQLLETNRIFPFNPHQTELTTHTQTTYTHTGSRRTKFFFKKCHFCSLRRLW